MTQEEILIKSQRDSLLREARALAENPNATKADLKLADVKIAQASSLKTKHERQVRVAHAMGTSAPEMETDGERDERRAAQEVREYLKYGRDAKTFRDLSVAVDTSGGFYVPQPFFYKVTSMLKAIDPLFDQDLVTFYESEDGNAMPAPLISDENVAATIVGEGVSGTPSIINAGRLFLAKCPTWRSGSLSYSVEFGMDSAFGLDDLIAAAVARRFRKGISAANVATLVSQAASALTTASLAAGVTLDNCADLLGSIDSDYLSSPNFRVLMNHATLTSLLKQRSNDGFYQQVIRYSEEEQAFTIFGKIIAISPSVASVAANAVPVIALDMSRWFQRTVKRGMTLLKYKDAPGLIENGLSAVQAFWRTNGGLLLVSGSDSPAKFITCAAS
jgi:HK97 family phage major capsid protein